MIVVDPVALEAAAAKNAFSGLVTVDIGGERTFEGCFGYLNRAHRVPIAADTQFAIASGSKSFTALAAMQLVSEGLLSLDRPVRDILGDDLPLIDDAVTLEQLLDHTSGIGDYLDEDSDWEVDDYVLTAPVHTLTTAEAFLGLLDGFPQKFAPGSRFSYCNGGYVVVAVMIERVTGETFHDVVRRLVFAPAQLEDTDYLRLDDLPGTAAMGYLDDVGNRVNTLHLPVLGNGDGGAFTTGDDLHRFWLAFHSGRIVAPSVVADMIRPRHDVPEEGLRSGLGMWLHATEAATVLEGYDAGAAFRSTHVPATRTTVSVLGNTSEGPWPVIDTMADAIDRALAS